MTIASRARFVALNILAPLALSWVTIGSLQALFHGESRPARHREFGTYGPLTLRLRLPGTHAGIEEPVVTVGRAGNATFVYLRLLPGSRAKVGIEFWGLSAAESREFAVSSPDALITVQASFPALYPAAGSPGWGLVSGPEQRRLLSGYLVAVDGEVRLRGPVAYEEPPRSPVYVGRNPLGGSYVSDYFTGTVVEAWHDF